MKRIPAPPPDWWDARKPGSFFASVYRRGDESLDGWLESGPMDLPARTARETEGAIALAQITPDDRVLDCPCGLGRHTLALRERGLQVTGVDLDPALTRAVGPPDPLNRSWVRADMRALPFASGSFTVVLNLVLSFGFFADEEDDQQVLREFARVLAPGGRLLLHTDINPARIAAGTYGDRPERRLPDGAMLRVEERFDELREQLFGRWSIERDGGLESQAGYQVRVISIDGLCGLFDEAGLRVTAIYGALATDASPYGPRTQEVVFLARKR
jgi:SAM-dependent methyltransferase